MNDEITLSNDQLTITTDLTTFIQLLRSARLDEYSPQLVELFWELVQDIDQEIGINSL